MTTFTDTQLHEIRHSAYEIASNEISNRGISDEDREKTIELTDFLYEARYEWASFDEDADSEAYEPVLAEFFA